MTVQTTVEMLGAQRTRKDVAAPQPWESWAPGGVRAWHRIGAETRGRQGGGIKKWTGWRGTQGHTSGEPRQPQSGDPPAKRLVSQPFLRALQGVEKLVPAAIEIMRRPGCRRRLDGRCDRTPEEPPNWCMWVTRWFTSGVGQLPWAPGDRPQGCRVQLQLRRRLDKNLQVGSPKRPRGGNHSH